LSIWRHDRAVKTASALAVAAALLVGCGAPERQNAHQSPSGQIDRSPAEILAMPDHYNNVASKCDGHGHRVYVTSNKDAAPSNMVIIADETC
jgi:predicted alpha/beta hydrolase family esterase